MGFVTIPILPSAAFDRTAEFYARLGFQERGRWPGEYLILARPDGMELHFWSNPAVDCATNDVACYVRFTSEAEARALHAAWSQVDVRPGRLGAPQSTDYGLVEFPLIDPDGNLVRVGGGSS